MPEVLELMMAVSGATASMRSINACLGPGRSTMTSMIQSLLPTASSKSSSRLPRLISLAPSAVKRLLGLALTMRSKPPWTKRLRTLGLSSVRPAASSSPGKFRRDDVEQRHRNAGIGKMAGNRRAHRASTDDGDVVDSIRHMSLLAMEWSTFYSAQHTDPVCHRCVLDRFWKSLEHPESSAGKNRGQEVGVWNVKSAVRVIALSQTGLRRFRLNTIRRLQNDIDKKVSIDARDSSSGRKPYFPPSCAPATA